MSGAIVIMGVTGSGKSTLGAALADALGWLFIEGDMLHPARNIQKMKAGIALDDADREPFLQKVAEQLVAHRDAGVVVSCSALKRHYRDQLRQQVPDVFLVLPLLDSKMLERRMRQRSDHFMPPDMLASQLETFEAPDPDESVIEVDGNAGTTQQVAFLSAALRSRGVSIGSTREPQSQQ